MKAFFEDGKLAESGRAAGWVLTPEKAGVVEARILSMLGSAQHVRSMAIPAHMLLFGLFSDHQILMQAVGKPVRCLDSVQYSTIAFKTYECRCAVVTLGTCPSSDSGSTTTFEHHKINIVPVAGATACIRFKSKAKQRKPRDWSATTTTVSPRS